MRALFPRGRGEEGFTLLELIIVLFLITLIVGLSAVFLSTSLSAGSLNSTAREMAASLRHARSMSHIRGETMTFTLDLDARTYGLTGYKTRPVPRGIGVRVIDPFMGEVGHGKYEVVFHALGGAQGGTIILSDDRGRKVTIGIDPVVGSLLLK